MSAINRFHAKPIDPNVFRIRTIVGQHITVTIHAAIPLVYGYASQQGSVTSKRSRPGNFKDLGLNVQKIRNEVDEDFWDFGSNEVRKVFLSKA